MFKSFSVTSNSKEGELFVNQSPIGMLKEGVYDVKDYPMTETADVYLKNHLLMEMLPQRKSNYQILKKMIK